MTQTAEERRAAVVEAAFGRLGLDAKARLLAGQDMWSLPALPEIGLGSLVMSDGPIGVRGVRWSADDPSVALPSPTALAATWDPALAVRAGVLLAQEARRKGVHVLLAPTVNLHRSPLGGRHFEAYSEDPYLTGRIGAGYVTGVQSGGVGTTVKHFVANDAETDRFTVDNIVGERALRELYLAPFEAVVATARPWGVMTAYNSVNGTTMTEHRHLVEEVLRDPDELIAEAVETARGADTAVVVVATTERVESEGFDREDLRLPGRQDDLVRAVAAANPNTVVIVNAGSPVELPWREEVAAVLLSWFPGQEGAAALADVLTGAHEPGGRLPTTWGSLADAPVTRVNPTDGALPYDEGVFIGHRAWQRAGRTPAYPFGHGLGYTDWAYESVGTDGTTVTVRVRNTGERAGREIIQVYLAPGEPDPARPARWLAGFASVEAGPGERAEATVELPRRAFEVWDEATASWSYVKGSYGIEAGRSIEDRRIAVTINV